MEEEIRLLIAHNKSVNVWGQHKRTPLLRAASEGATNVVRELLGAKALVDARDEWSNTALHMAVNNGHTECAMLLLEGQANVHLPDCSKVSPLHSAANNGHERCVQLLIRAGAVVSGLDDRELLLDAGGKYEKCSLPEWMTQMLQRRKSCKDAAIVLYGILRFRTPSVRPSGFGRDMYRELATYVWGTRYLGVWLRSESSIN